MKKKNIYIRQIWIEVLNICPQTPVGSIAINVNVKNLCYWITCLREGRVLPVWGIFFGNRKSHGFLLVWDAQEAWHIRIFLRYLWALFNIRYLRRFEDLQYANSTIQDVWDKSYLSTSGHIKQPAKVWLFLRYAAGNLEKRGEEKNYLQLGTGTFSNKTVTLYQRPEQAKVNFNQIYSPLLLYDLLNIKKSVWSSHLSSQSLIPSVNLFPS